MGLGSETSGVAAPPERGTATNVVPGASERSINRKGSTGRHDVTSGWNSVARSGRGCVVAVARADGDSGGVAVGVVVVAALEGGTFATGRGESATATMASATTRTPTPTSTAARIWRG